MSRQHFRNIERLGGFTISESSKKEQFDDGAFARVMACQRVQGIVNVHKCGVGVRADIQRLVKGDLLYILSALFAVQGSCVVNQDASQQPRRYGIEMGPISERNIRFYKADICLVDQCSRSQCMFAPLGAHASHGELMQLLVDDGHELIQRALVPVTPALQ
jgi:hypothetical protein